MKKLLSLLMAGTFFMTIMATPVVSSGYDSAPSSSLSRQLDTSDSPRNDPAGEMIIADVLFLRVAGLVAMVIGAAGAVLAMPFAAITGDCDVVCRAMLVRPYEYTFVRPLGQTDWPASSDDTNF